MRVRRAVIDTNVLIFAHFEDSEYHEEARKILSSLNEWIIPFIVVIELLWFSRGTGLNGKRRRNLILSILTDSRVRISHIDLDDLIESSLIEDPLEFEDELILHHAEKEGVPLATFDRSLAERAKRRGLQVIPERSLGK